MLVPNRNASFDNENYRYGFQGQERDDELKGEGNSINYTFRMHDPRVGRFFSVDPLAPRYPHYSPYNFSGNKVIAFTELEGLEEKTVHKRQSILESIFSSIKKALGLDYFDNMPDDARDENHRAEIRAKQKQALVRTEKATENVKAATKVTIGVAASPFLAYGVGAGISYAAPAVASTYESYTIWYGSSAIYQHFASGLSAPTITSVFTTNSVRVGSINAIVTAGGDYIAGGFDYRAVDPLKTSFSTAFGGIFANMVSSSFQRQSIEIYTYRLSTASEFSMDFTFGTINESIGKRINGFGLSEFNKSIGGYMESIMRMGAEGSTNTVKKELEKSKNIENETR